MRWPFTQAAIMWPTRCPLRPKGDPGADPWGEPGLTDTGPCHPAVPTEHTSSRNAEAKERNAGEAVSGQVGLGLAPGWSWRCRSEFLCLTLKVIGAGLFTQSSLQKCGNGAFFPICFPENKTKCKKPRREPRTFLGSPNVWVSPPSSGAQFLGQFSPWWCRPGQAPRPAPTPGLPHSRREARVDPTVHTSSPSPLCAHVHAQDMRVYM